MKKITIFLFLLLISQSIFSQTDKLPGVTHTEVTSSPIPDAQITEVVKNLRESRISNDLTSVNYWQDRLKELTFPQVIYPDNDALHCTKGHEGNTTPSEALNLTRVTDAIIVANAISRERINGDIYAAIGVYGGVTISDTLKIYRSSNNGLSFTLILAISQGNLKIDYNGVDIEAVSKGDSSFAFVTMAYTLGGFKSASVIRTRQDGNLASVLNIAGTATNNYSNIRLTSDNSFYSTTAYCYISVTLDSIAGGTRNLRSKFFQLLNIYGNTISLVSGYQGAGGQYGYYVAGSAPDSAKFESDIAYVNTEANADQLYTVTVVRGIPGLFGSGTSLSFTLSNTYGATAPTLFNATDPGYLKESPRIACTGYHNNSAMVMVRRLYAGGDWDPYYFYTANITNAAPIFDANYVDGTSDTTMGVSVAGKQRSNGSYLFAYNNKLNGPNESRIFTRAYNNGILGTATQSNPSNVSGTNLYGYPDAGFRNVNNDSCLVIWTGIAGNGCYVTGGCSGTVFTGTGNLNSAPDNFYLLQNYPNPFNPTTKINYSLPSQSNVSIKIFDVLGKEVSSLVNEMQAAGVHSIEFNAVNLPSGVYYYRIEAGDFADTKKMLLVK